ncbi:MAG: carboxypeptidase regulatory-like domain-containing protein [Candidatus Acidiferrales bacterium]
MRLWAIVVIIRVAILALIGALCGLAAHAQGTGAIHGQVLDPSGASVAGASIIVTTPDQQTLGAVANQQGAFDLKNLAAGTYKLEVIAKGFTPYSNDAVHVAAGQTQQLKISLAIEVEQQQVVVTDSPVAVDVSPTNNAGAITLSGHDLDALPDDPDELQTDLTALAGPSAGPNGGQFYIDGFTAGQLPPKSAIREIRINSNPFSAQYDKVGYGRIEIFTKPGTDKWHGQVSVNANPSGINSKNPFFDESASESGYPSYYSVQYSGNVGGPLSKKASFFVSSDIRDINNLSIVNAQTLNAEGMPEPFSAAVPLPQRRYNVAPKLDYQLGKNNTLSVRYQYYRNSENNAGVGGFTLPSQGYDTVDTENTVQVSDTQTFGSKIVNETRFQYVRDALNEVPQSTDPTITVPLYFSGGGSAGGMQMDTTNRYELQNYTSIQYAKHFLKFGMRLRGVTDDDYSTAGFNGSYYFPSLAAYQATLAGTPSAAQYTLTTAPAGATAGPNPVTNIGQVDVGLYVEDDWRMKPNITLSYGLRFESQDNISDHADWAPRLGFAWGIGGGGKNAPKTVLRAGFGIFYDRFDESNVLTENRLNNVNLTQFVVTNPAFYAPTPPPLVPSTTTLESYYLYNNRQKSPGTMQMAISLERQLTKWANLNVSYLHSQGWDQLLTNNVNTPTGITFPYYLNPGTGTRPPQYDAPFANIYQYLSEANFNQNQLFVQSTVRAGTKATLFAYYVLNYANSDTSGVNSFPSNPMDIAEDYGRASFDVRNRFFMGGSIGLPKGFRLSPFMVASSGYPYSITLNQDLIGSSQFNQRPSSVPNVNPNYNVTVPGFGTYNSLPNIADEIPINSLTSAGRFTLNLRLAKTFGFGKETNGGAGSGGGGGGRGGRGGGNPFGGGFGFGGGTGTTQRYNLTLSANARNIFNNVNTAVPSATIIPPQTLADSASYSTRYFGIPNALAGGPFSSTAANRQIYLQASFSF